MKRNPYVKSDVDTLSLREAREIAGVSKQTLYTWMERGHFNAKRQTNGYVLIEREGFLNYINTLRNKRNKKEPCQ